MRSALEVADIFRRHGPAYRAGHGGHLGRVERRVMSAIELCRTAALGGHVEACEDCAHTRVAFNSCCNRHCPKCQGATRERWLVNADETSVTFRWSDYRHGNAPRLMSLDLREFIRRFLIHSLPDGFHRVRHYGFLANGCRRARLEIIRQLLAQTMPVPIAATGETTTPLPRFDPTVCPCCGGVLRITATLPRGRPGPSPSQPDTS